MCFERWSRYLLLALALPWGAVCAGDDLQLPKPEQLEKPPFANPAEEKDLLAMTDLAAPTTSQEAFLSLFMDRVYQGELLALISSDGELVKVRYRDLKPALVEEIPPQFLEELAERQDMQGWLDPRALDRYAPYFNFDDLSLALRTPAHEKGQQTIDLGGKAQPDLTKVIQASDKSAYCNFRNAWSQSNNKHHYLLDMTAAFRYHDWVAEGRFDLDTERDRFFDYTETRLVRDYPENLTRLVVGDTNAFRPRLLASDQIQGVRYSREFTLRPNAITEPVSEFTFILERDSFVEISINGERQRTMRLPAGPYNLRNFTITSGFNDIVIKVTDDLGTVDYLTFGIVSGPNLLAPGKSEFVYSAGVEGHGHVYTDNWVISASHRQGILDQLTLNAEARASEHHQGLGVGCDFALPWFYGTIDVAASHREDADGLAGRLILGRSVGRFQVTGRVDYRQRTFLDQKQNLSQSRIRAAERISMSGPLPKDLGMLYSSFTNERRWYGDKTRKAELRWERRFGACWRLELAYLHDQYGTPKHDGRAVLHYTYVGEKINRTHLVRARSQSQAIENTFAGKQNKGWWGDWKASHYRDMGKGRKPVDSINGSFRRQSNRFTSYYSVWVDDIGRENVFRHNANIGTALVWVDGDVAVGRPVIDSFALVAVPPDFDNKELQILRSGEVVSHATKRMAAVVPNLHAYHTATLDVETEDFDFEAQRFSVFPSYRSGMKLEPGDYDELYGPLTIHGTLVDGTGSLLSLKALIVTNVSNPEAERFFSFTNYDGLFQASGFNEGSKYRIDVVEDASLYYEFVVPAAEDGNRLLNLGSLAPAGSQGQSPVSGEQRPPTPAN